MAEPEVAETTAVRAGTVNHPSLKDAAAAYLREQILTGKLTPGHQDRPGRDQRGARDEPVARCARRSSSSRTRA